MALNQYTKDIAKDILVFHMTCSLDGPSSLYKLKALTKVASFCEGHAKASQYLSSLGLGHSILFKTCIAMPFLAIFSKRWMPILSKTQLLLALTSLPLGTNTEASLSPTLKCQSKGVPNHLL